MASRANFLLKKVEKAPGQFGPVPVLFAALVLVLYAYFLSLNLSELGKVLFYDESQWIWVSQKYFGDVIRGDFRNPHWQENYARFGNSNPKIAQYLIGISLYLSGELNTKFPAMKWNWNKDRYWNIWKGHSPPWRTLFYGRIPMPFLGAFCGVLFFYLTTRIMSWPSALVATLFFGSSEVLTTYSARAMQDVPALFFNLLFLAVLFSIPWRKVLPKFWTRTFLYAAVSGFFLGLAVSTKLNNLVLIGVFGLYLFWVTVVEMEPKLRISLRKINRFLICSIVGMLVCGMVFVGSNPYLYSTSPLKTFQKSKILFQLGAEVRKSREEEMNKKYAIYSSREKFKQINRKILKGAISGKPALNWAIILAGLIFLLFRLRSALKKGSASETDHLVLALLAGAIIFIGNFCWIPFNWGRHFLPFLTPLAIAIGFSVEIILYFFTILYNLISK